MASSAVADQGPSDLVVHNEADASVGMREDVCNVMICASASLPRLAAFKPQKVERRLLGCHRARRRRCPPCSASVSVYSNV